MKTATLSQFLTDAQIFEARKLFVEADAAADAVTEIQERVITPNMAAINAKLGQENDARYLAYMVVQAFGLLSIELADHFIQNTLRCHACEGVTRDSRRCSYCGGKGWIFHVN